jgi:hypothetical protein
MLPSKHSRILTNLPWLGLLLLIILSISFLLPVLPNDFWWYLRLGQDIVTTTNIPLVDTYSSTVFGQPVSYPMWLSAVILFVLHQLGDLTAVVFARGLFISAFYTFLWIICIKKGAPGWLATLLTLVCALAGANNWAVRPQMFVYPLFGLTLYFLSEYSDEMETNPQKIDSQQKSLKFFLLIPIAQFWANLHGSVILFFFITTPYYLFHQRNNKFLLILILAFLATFINPRGPLLWLDTFQLIQANGNQFSQEWKPPVNAGWQMNLFFMWLLAFIPMVAYSTKKLRPYEWIWLMGFGWMALSGVRYAIWFLALLLIFSCWLMQGILKKNTNAFKFQLIPFNITILVILTLLPLSLLPGIRENWWKQSPDVILKDTPVDAVNWLKAHPDLPEPIFNDYIYGSYLIYALPERPVWIDTRFHIYSFQHWENYLSITNAEAGWFEKLKEEDVGTIMLDKISQKKLIDEIKGTSNFCDFYEDDQSIIFSKCE